MYNSAKYIDNCLESISQQSYRDFEVILVNDGSQDDTETICKKYINSQFKYFYIPNSGVSHARNYGLKQANGEYVCFVDSDDSLEIDYLETLYKGFTVGTNIDFSLVGFNIYSEKGEKVVTYSSNEEKLALNLIEKVVNRDDYICALWNKMYRRLFLLENDIDFNELISNGEDYLFVMTCMVKAKNIYLSRGVGYNYNIRKGSASHLKSFDEKLITSVNAFSHMEKLFPNGSEYSNKIKEQKMVCITSNLRLMKQEGYDDVLLYKKLLNYLRYNLNFVFKSELSLRQKVNCIFTSISPSMTNIIRGKFK